MEWLVFSVLMIHYVAKVIDFWPKSEPRRPVRGPFRYRPGPQAAARAQEIIQVYERQIEARKRRRDNREKVDWKKEGF
jgi:hypothetical protein